MSLSATHVFWVDTAAGSILSVPKSGGTSVVVAGGLGYPRFVVYRDSWVYFSAETKIDHDFGAVARIRIVGGNPVGATEPLATGRDLPKQLSGDASHVYWIEGRQILRYRIDGQ